MELSLERVSKSFGGLRAVGDVSFTVRDNAIFGLIGPNGAGKTTVFNLVTGVYQADEGRIRFGNEDLTERKPAQIAACGIGRTFQNIRLFGQLTVVENLLVACELQKRAHLASAVLRLRVHYEDEQAMHERALELLRVFDLHEMADESPTSLSYGNQRRLEIARAMMLEPKLLLLDEPAAGMNYGEAEGLKTQIRWLRDTFDLSVVLVEHNMQVVMGVCEEIHVLDRGESIAHGSPAEVRRDPKVLAAYLGEEEEASASVLALSEASKLDLPRLPLSDRDITAGKSDLPRLPLSDRDITALKSGLPRLPLSDAQLAAQKSGLPRLPLSDAQVGVVSDPQVGIETDPMLATHAQPEPEIAAETDRMLPPLPQSEPDVAAETDPMLPRLPQSDPDLSAFEMPNRAEAQAAAGTGSTDETASARKAGR